MCGLIRTCITVVSVIIVRGKERAFIASTATMVISRRSLTINGGGENKSDIRRCFIVFSYTRQQLHDAIPMRVLLDLEREDTIPNGIIDLQ